MPKPNDSGWTLKYANPISDARFLVAMPSEMLRDLRVLAGSRDIPIAEQVRRLITAEVDRLIQADPALARSFRGSRSLK